MTRAILTCWHKYQPYGGEYYEPLLDFYIGQMKKFEDEYDQIYFLDSTWNIDAARLEGLKATIIKVDQSTRYYDVYKEVLPQVKEDLVLLMDDDMVVYKPGLIGASFELLKPNPVDGESYDVVSIYDTIGTYQTNQLNGKNKLCPYWFATRKDLLMQYRDIDWAPHMPHSETLGLLTEAMLKDGVKCFEFEEDKSNYLFGEGGTKGRENFGKDLGYYHIRAGSTPAYLMAENKYGNPDTYRKYLDEQPRSEYLRQLAWYWYMCAFILTTDVVEVLEDASVDVGEFMDYLEEFATYHGLT